MKKEFLALIAAIAALSVAMLCVSSRVTFHAKKYIISTETASSPFAAICLDGESYIPITFEELDGGAAIIVQGTVQDSEDLESTPSEGATSLSVVTRSTLKITKVIRGDFQPGDELPIGEPYGYCKPPMPDVSAYIAYGMGYLPSKPGVEYLFYLAEPSDRVPAWNGLYLVRDYSLGRYAVVNGEQYTHADIDGMTAEELGIRLNDTGKYQDFYKKVIEKYMR